MSIEQHAAQIATQAGEAPEASRYTPQIAGQYGTKPLLRDSFVPTCETQNPQAFSALEPDLNRPLVPVISKKNKIAQQDPNKPSRAASSPSNAQQDDDELDPFKCTAHGRAWAVCKEQCAKVEGGERKLSELKALYPGEWNSFRNIPGRVATLDRTVSEDWEQNGFIAFLRGKGPKAKDEDTLDRVDNENPHYATETTKWSDKGQQTRNRRNTVFIYDAKGVAWTPREMSKTKFKGKVKENTIRTRKRRGWTDAELHSNKQSRPRKADNVQLTANFVPLVTTEKVKSRMPSPDEKLADYWEHVMRELTPKAAAPLDGKERGRLRVFGDYLDICDLCSDKLGVIEFVIRNWDRASEYVCTAIGKYRAPAVASPNFLADHARHFINFVTANYKPIDASAPQFTGDAKSPASPAHPAPPQAKVQVRRQVWLADHPVTFIEYQRELWRDYRVMGTVESYETWIARWFTTYDPDGNPMLPLLPTYVQEIVIRRRGLQAQIVEPPPADPTNPPERFCPGTGEIVYLDPVEHSDPFPGDEPSSAPTDTISLAEEAETTAGGPLVSRSPACSVGSDPTEADSSQDACPETEAALLSPTSPTWAPPAFPTTSTTGKPVSRSLMLLLGLPPGAVEYADGQSGKNAISCN